MILAAHLLALQWRTAVIRPWYKRPGDLYTASRRDTVRPQAQAPDGRPHRIGEPDYLTSSSSPLLAKMRLFYTDSHLLS